MKWEVLNSGTQPAEKIMALDGHLLYQMDKRSNPILHLYDWAEQTITYGLLVDPKKFLNEAIAKKLGFALAKRPTGGGIVFHSWDLAFSMVVPAHHPQFSQKPIENYHWIHQLVGRAIQKFLHSSKRLELQEKEPVQVGGGVSRFCMAKPTQYDLVVGRKKIAGAAQRKTKEGFLHQGMISLQMPDLAVLRQLLLDPSIEEAIKAHTYPIGEGEDLQTVRKELKELLQKEVNLK